MECVVARAWLRVGYDAGRQRRWRDRRIRKCGVDVGIVVPELARSLDIVVAQGGTVAVPLTDNGWVIKAQILDPAGNRVTLIQG